MTDIELTEDERANGWTKESLAAYLAFVKPGPGPGNNRVVKHGHEKNGR